MLALLLCLQPANQSGPRGKLHNRATGSMWTSVLTSLLQTSSRTWGLCEVLPQSLRIRNIGRPVSCRSSKERIRDGTIRIRAMAGGPDEAVRWDSDRSPRPALARGGELGQRPPQCHFRRQNEGMAFPPGIHKTPTSSRCLRSHPSAPRKEMGVCGESTTPVTREVPGTEPFQ